METEIVKRIRKQLFELQDLGYKEFHKNLIPNISEDTIIGVRTPQLREMVKTLKKDEHLEEFLTDLPHIYYDENQLHAFLISEIKDFEQCIGHVDAFLPYVNNWATSDQMSPKIFKKNAEQLLPYIRKWLQSGQTYHIRFAIGMLMAHFLDEKFDTTYADMVAGVKSDEYYVNMMCAWYFATALAKQYEQILPYLENKRLPVWVHNKTIQKAIESYRIDDDKKSQLRLLKVK